MLQNAYFLAKIGADTTENEQHFAENLPKIGNYPTIRTSTSYLRRCGAQCRARSRSAARCCDAPRRRRQRASVGKISAKCCSFSAVSAPIFARKYAFCSIFQNLPNYLTEFFTRPAPQGIAELGEDVWRSDRRPDERGLRIVGTPVGSNECIAAFLQNHLQTQRELIDMLPCIGDPQSTFLILRLCAVPRANHLATNRSLGILPRSR